MSRDGQYIYLEWSFTPATRSRSWSPSMKASMSRSVMAFGAELVCGWEVRGVKIVLLKKCLVRPQHRPQGGPVLCFIPVCLVDAHLENCIDSRWG